MSAVKWNISVWNLQSGNKWKYSGKVQVPQNCATGLCQIQCVLQRAMSPHLLLPVYLKLKHWLSLILFFFLLFLPRSSQPTASPPPLLPFLPPSLVRRRWVFSVWRRTWQSQGVRSPGGCAPSPPLPTRDNAPPPPPPPPASSCLLWLRLFLCLRLFLSGGWWVRSA